MANKQGFRNSRFYSIFFMVVVTVFFISVLAVFYHLTYDKVRTYREDTIKKLILTSFNLPAENVENFTKFITKKEEEITYYIAERAEEKIGYCFPIRGKGLWGTIDALVAVTPDFKKIINLEIVDQNETPGLGARITEDWFLDQFSGKIIKENKEVNLFKLVPEDEKTGTNQINQVTGATSSSRAVLKMLHEEYADIVKLMDKNYD